MLPPNQDVLSLEVGAEPSHVIDRHNERIANRSDVRRFNEDSVLDEIVHGSQMQFDFLVGKGLYTPLSGEETNRLVSISETIWGKGEGLV